MVVGVDGIARKWTLGGAGESSRFPIWRRGPDEMQLSIGESQLERSMAMVLRL